MSLFDVLPFGLDVRTPPCAGIVRSHSQQPLYHLYRINESKQISADNTRPEASHYQPMGVNCLSRYSLSGTLLGMIIQEMKARFPAFRAPKMFFDFSSNASLLHRWARPAPARNLDARHLRGRSSQVGEGNEKHETLADTRNRIIKTREREREREKCEKKDVA